MKTAGETSVSLLERLEEDSSNDLSHLICDSQKDAWKSGEPAMARCGYEKSGWVPAEGKSMLCVVCVAMFRMNKCSHCQHLTEGSN